MPVMPPRTSTAWRSGWQAAISAWHIGLDAGDLGVEGREDAVQAWGKVAHAGCLDAVLAGDALFDEVLTGRHQPVEPVALAVARSPAGEAVVPLAAVVRQRPGIDGVGLAERAEGADEGLGLAGIGAMRGAAGTGQRIEQERLVPACRLADHQRAGIERGGEVGQGGAGVANPRDALCPAVEDDDLGLADIAADEAGGNGSGRVHGRLSFQQLVIVCGRGSAALATHQASREADG